MRRASLLLLMPLAACASSGSTSSPTPVSQTVRVVGAQGGASMTMGGGTGPNVHTIPYAMDRVWRTLPTVFDSIGIPVATLDPVKRSIGNSAFKVRGRLRGVPLSRYIDCGNSTQIGPNADSYDVNVTLMADLRPAEAGTTTIIVTMDAVARPANFAQEYSQCSSRGVLEARFIDILNARLQR